MAKVIDHSGTNIEPTRGVSTHVIGIASDDHFIVKATDPNGRVSAHRAAHATTYENNSPNYLLEPPGMLDISDSQYEQVDPGTIKVTGSRFVERPYTIKLEGAELIGLPHHHPGRHAGPGADKRAGRVSWRYASAAPPTTPLRRA